MKFLAKILFLLISFVAVCQSTQAGWQKVPSNTLSWLHAIYFVDSKKGWIGGSNGTFLATKDGGVSWQPVKKFTDETIKDIYFSDENHGWALIEKDVYGGAISPSSILQTADGGNTWKKAMLDGSGKERLVRMFFSKEGAGRAVGEAGTLFELQQTTGNWRKINIPVRYLLLDGSFLDQSKVLVVGGGGSTFFTEDDGNSWKPAIFTKKPDSKLNSVFFINQNVGWIVGAGGKIYSTNNGGKRWREQNSGITNNLLDVCFMNTAEGWAVGDDGTILHTLTAGNIWEKEFVNTKHKLESVFFNGENAWSVGFGGTILVYESSSSKNNKFTQVPVLQKRPS